MESAAVDDVDGRDRNQGARSEEARSDMNAGQADAQPEDAEHQTARTQPQSQLEGQQAIIAGAVENLSVVQLGVDEVSAYLSTGTQALRRGEDDGVRDVWRVLCDAYGKLLHVSSILNDALNALDPDGAQKRDDAREREFS